MKSALAALLVAVLVVPSVYAKDDFHGVPPAGAAAKGASLVVVCAACHGSNGIGKSAAYPSLAGQKYNYILKQLENFRDGKRTSSVMSGMAMTIPASKNHANLKAIAAYFAGLKPMSGYAPTGAAPSAAQIALGKTIYERGVADDDIPSCAACHGLGGEGNDPMAIPVLAGQHSVYVVNQLERFASSKRHNSPGHVMHTIARELTAKQRAAVAAYVQQLKPDTTLGLGPKDFKAYARSLSSADSAGSGTGGKTSPAAATSKAH